MTAFTTNYLDQNYGWDTVVSTLNRGLASHDPSITPIKDTPIVDTDMSIVEMHSRMIKLISRINTS